MPARVATATPVMTSCDVYVDGTIYWTFRGKLELSDGVVRVKGDRSTVGGDCVSNPELLLPPTEPEEFN